MKTTLDTNLHNLRLQREKLQRMLRDLPGHITQLDAAILAAECEAKGMTPEQADRLEANRRINASRIARGVAPYPDDCITKAAHKAFDIALRKAAREARKKM